VQTTGKPHPPNLDLTEGFLSVYSRAAMPIYMDRHNATGAKTADLAEAHRRDLEAQARHEVSFLAYWFDAQRGLAFCLVEAPSDDAVAEVHRVAHGNVPSEIIEVDLEEVRTFYGRTSDPDSLELVDSAYRTILFTDLVGSTSLALTVGDLRAVELLAIHDRIVGEAVVREGGRMVKHTGDGILATFHEVDAALRAGIRIQQRLDLEARGVEAAEVLTVRIGINPGNPVDRSDDIFGVAVAVAARLCALAEPGQILVSGVVKELVQDRDLADRLLDAGRQPVRGLVSALHVYGLEWQQL
jgi:class 3 adenylate cyclase